tara:strand:+ start:2921 stop:3082 length:162 start_codon:yes stop_codon:yes gene_type:complete
MKIRNELIKNYENKKENLVKQRLELNHRILGAIEVLEKLIDEEKNPKKEDNKK